MKKFGLDRVLEPKGALPATAWQMDNSPQLRPGEIRVSVEKISFERGNFNQICNACNYEQERIKERIKRIVNVRGKLQNPYTNSSGMFVGVVEQISDKFSELDDSSAKTCLRPGDRVFCLTPLAGLPLHIDSIDDINYGYAQIKCTGYVICFESSDIRLCHTEDEAEEKYLLRAFEEEGSLKSVSTKLGYRKIRSCLIIGAGLIETLFYTRLAYDSNPGNVKISIVMDKSIQQIYGYSDVRGIFRDLTEQVHFVDLSMPTRAAEQIYEETGELEVDAVINLENISGSESFASLAVKDGGIVFYMGMNNGYSQGLLAADCMGKKISVYALEGYNSDAYPFALELVDKLRRYFRVADQLFTRGNSRSVVLPRKKERTQLAAKKIDDFIYMSPVTTELIEEVLNVAQYDCNVIIQGETGVGKEKVLNLLHNNSLRCDRPCIKINCASIAENLAESEFFGYEKGSFTGAQAQGKAGYFELANNGTLFLDEIGSLPLSMQTKLLRVLQENTYYRVGGTEPKRVNVRVICANNIPLKTLVSNGTFREDLYYRLNICVITVPPLRMRKDDIGCLAAAFIENYSEKYGAKKEFSSDAYDALRDYPWPGNVRELENAVHRLYISQKGLLVDGVAVKKLLGLAGEDSLAEMESRLEEGGLDFKAVIDEQEKKLIAMALKKCGTTRAAAEFLKIPQATLARKKIRYGL